MSSTAKHVKKQKAPQASNSSPAAQDPLRAELK